MEIPNERTHGDVRDGNPSEEKDAIEKENRGSFRQRRRERRAAETEKLLITPPRKST
jgi:hypothetical protein|tara:strand:- start:726 stop:896 length:171 start_codon:yes stop_codon:yes gene_type:complete